MGINRLEGEREERREREERGERREEREERGERRVDPIAMWTPHKHLKVILTPFNHFNDISYGRS